MPQLFGVALPGYLYLTTAAVSCALLPYSAEISPLATFSCGWIAAAYGVVSTAYFSVPGASEVILGKKKDGSVPLIYDVALLPWKIPVYVFWWGVYLVTPEPSYNLVAKDLYVARRPLSAKCIPEGTKLVVDVTGEFSAAKSVRQSTAWRYTCCASFDTLAPVNSHYLNDTIELMLACKGPIFVHCAFGHGRSSMVAAIYLVRKGVCKDIASAEAMMQKSRPRIHLNAHQRFKAEQYFRDRAKERN